MPNLTNKRIKIIITVAIIISLITATVIGIVLYINNGKSDIKAIKDDTLILYDNVNDNSVTLDIPNYRTSSKTHVYLEDSNALTMIKNQLTALDPRYEITIYNDVLLYARIENEAIYYVMRCAAFPSDYGMLFKINNTQETYLSENITDGYSEIFIPLHLFYAPTTTYSYDFPFASSVQYNAKLKIVGAIEEFFIFYQLYNNIEVSRENNLLYVRNTVNNLAFWIQFGDDYVTCYALNKKT